MDKEQNMELTPEAPEPEEPEDIIGKEPEDIAGKDVEDIVEKDAKDIVEKEPDDVKKKSNPFRNIPSTLSSLARREDSELSFKAFLLFSVFVAGTVVFIIEIMGSRVLSNHFGSTVYVWGSQILVVLTALSIGYYAGGRLADKHPERQTFGVVLLLAGLLIFLILLLKAPAMDLVVSTRVGPVYGPLLGSLALFLAPGLMLGMVSPFAIRLAAKTLENIGNVAGSLYSVSTAGSVLGSFASVFILIPLTSISNIILGASLLVVFSSLFAFKGKFRIMILALALVMAPAGLALASDTYIPDIGDVEPEDLKRGDCPAQLQGFGEKICSTLYSVDSPYQHVSVVDGHTLDIRYLILEDTHGAMHRSGDLTPIFLYESYFHLGFVLNPEIKDILMIGGGAFAVSKRMINDYPDVTIDVVELDPIVVKVAKGLFRVEDNDRHRIYVDDGRNFLVNTDKKYDLIMLDAYTEFQIPFHLLTVEFMQLVKDHLKPNGIVESNIITALTGERSDLFRAEYHTMAQLFPSMYVFPTNQDEVNVQNVMVIATTNTDRLTSDAFVAKAVEAMDRDWIKIPDITFYANSYIQDTIATSEHAPLTDNNFPIIINPATGANYVPMTFENTTI